MRLWEEAKQNKIQLAKVSIFFKIIGLTFESMNTNILHPIIDTRNINRLQ